MPEAVQHGWDDFCERVALPLRESIEKVRRTSDADHVCISRHRWDLIFLSMAGLETMLGIYGGVVLDLPRMFAAPFPFVALWVWLRCATPRTGLVARRIGSRPGGVCFLWFLLGWGTVGFAVVALVNRVAARLPHRWVWGSLALLAWFAVLLFAAAGMDRQMVEERRRRQPLARREWDAEEHHAKVP